MDIKRKESKLVISNQSSVIKTPKKKRKFFGFLKGSKSPLGLLEPKKLFKTKKRKLIFSLALILLIIAPLSFYLWNKQAGASWWNSDWNYRRSITINSAQIPGDLNNFPMLVSFTDSNLINKTQSNGNDIIFIEENGTRLDHEIEKFDSTTGELVVWVKIPELDGDNDSIIYMYYGNQTVDNQQRPEDVWDDGFKTVQHLEEGGTGTRYDSTKNNTDATTQNYNGDESVVAKIDGGGDFEYDDSTYLDLGTPESLNINQGVTLSAWVRSESDTSGRIISKHGDSPNFGYMLARAEGQDNIQFGISVDGVNWESAWSADNTFLSNTWYNITVTFDGFVRRMFINGTEHLGGSFPESSVSGNINISNASTQIGRDEYMQGNTIFDGIIDEVRISNTARSANWITTEYNNQNSPATFISLGQEERGPAPVLYLPFDEGFGTTAHDETSNRNDGTIVGATWKDESMCKSGKCLEFDGTGDYVEIADNQSLDLSEEVTLEAWVKPTSTTPQNQTILSKVETPNDPTKIYRSVGPSATTAIAVGTTNAMNITGDRATFATALPDNVGVGDAIQYDANDDGTVDALAFITGRISNTQYTISNASGGAPNPVNSDNNWSLFRAYTSLANAESGIENTGINTNLRNFDDWTAGGDATTDDLGKDLVASNQQWNIACYNDAVDGAEMVLNDWNTGADNYIKIYTPVNNSEVGVSQRHNGTWGNGYRRTEQILLRENYARVDGISIQQGDTCSNYSNRTFFVREFTGVGYIEFTNNFGQLTNATTTCDVFDVYLVDAITVVMVNNIGISNSSDSTSEAFYVNDGDARAYLYNNTGRANGGSAFKIGSSSTTAFASNNLGITTAATGYDFAGSFDSMINNASSDASADDWGGSNNKINQTFAFIDYANNDLHLAPTDTAAKNSGADLSYDSFYPFNSDIDGQSRDSSSKVGMTDKWDVGADEAIATQIYRSVAPSKTDALETGEENSLTIVGNTATFQRALADNIGVGDAIQYDDDNDGDIDANDSLAFIVERITNYEYRITNASGGTPVPVNSDTNWSLFRAYTSLANAENGTENTGIDSDLRNFDTWTGGKDLVTSKEQWNIACYANETIPDTTAVTVDGWTTGVQNFVKIYTPTKESEVGVSQRHSGKWDDGKYRHETVVDDSDVSEIQVFDNYIIIEGLLISGYIPDGNDSYYRAIRIGNPSNGSIIRDNIIEIRQNHAYGNIIGIYLPEPGAGSVVNVFNNIVYISEDTSANKEFGILVEGDNFGKYVLDNNTVFGCASGIMNWSSRVVVARNNIVQNVSDGYDGTFDASSDYNISDLASDAPSPSYRSGLATTVSFVDEGNYDFHLSKTDTLARNVGVNLFNDTNLPIKTDIDGENRLSQGSFDIGADEAVATKIYRSVGPNNTSALATDDGHENSIVVSSGVASFSANIPDNVGVGDAVIIDTGGTANAIDASDTLLFISKRISSTTYELQTHTGAIPSNITSNDTYQIFRAYTSLANAESGTKNTSIPITFNGGNRDLVTNNEEWNIACYGDAVDTTMVNIDSWTTGAENNIKVYTPSDSSDVGISQRHVGKWDNNKYRLEYTSTATGQGALATRDDYIFIDGLQILLKGSYADGSALVAGANNIVFANNIIKSESTGLNITGIRTGASMKAFNNIIYDFSTANSSAFFTDWLYGNLNYWYNNTVYNCTVGFDLSGNAIWQSGYLFNNIASNCSTACYVYSAAWPTYNNISSDGTADDGGYFGNRANQSTSFRDASNDDFRLAMTDITAKGLGLNAYNSNPSLGFVGVGITSDIEGELRPNLLSSLVNSYQLPATSYDIGADQISNTVHNNYSLNLKTDYPQANFSTSDNDQDNFSSGDINLEPNTWSHLVYKRSNDTEEMYINGSKKDSGTISNFLKTNNGKLYLGAKDSNSTNSFKGFLDEVRIYPYARTEAEVKKDTTQGSSGRAASRASEGVSVSIGETGNSLSDGLVGYWKMDETSWNGTVNEVKDASGNNNHGTAVDGATTGAGKFGSGGGFDGVDDYVDTDLLINQDGNTSYSFSFWARPTGACSGGYCFAVASDSGDYEWSTIYSDDNNWHVYNGSGRIAQTAVKYNEWQHITTVYDHINDEYRFYFNGSFVKSGSITYDIGVNPLSFGEIYTGQIDETRIYNRTLSADEIKQLYNYAPGPVLHLKMDEKSGTTAFDSSGNDNHGTLTNGPIWENGKINGGVRFDGSDDFIDLVGNMPSGNKARTISFWFNASSFDTSYHDCMFSYDYSGTGGYGFSVYAEDNSVSVDFYNNRIIAPKNIISPNIWNFVSIVVPDGAILTTDTLIYINGKMMSTTNEAGSAQTLNTNRSNVQIGDRSLLDQPFSGLIDDVKIYNYARTPEQILEDMNAQSSSIIGSEGNVLQKPILDLNFDEGQGSTAYDASGNGNDGTLNAGAAGTNTTATAMWDKGGKKGGAMEFDGTNDYVAASDSPFDFERTDSFTLSAWVKTGLSNGFIFSKQLGSGNWTGYSLYISANALGMAIVSDTSPSSYIQVRGPSNAVVNNNQWHHVVATYDGSSSANGVRLYIDNQRQSLTIDVDTLTSSILNDVNLDIGYRSTEPSGAFNGKIDEVKIYNYALSEDEIKTLYNDSSAMVMGNDESRDNNGTEVTGANKDYCIPGDTAKCDKPVLELKMDEMTGTTAYDTSGNGNNGTLTGGPVWDRGKIGNALSFPLNSDYISLGSSNSFALDEYTISTYVNIPANIPTGQVDILNRRSSGDWSQSNFILNLVNDSGTYPGRIDFAHVTSGDVVESVVGNADIRNSGWRFLTVSYDGINQSIYLDGKLEKAELAASPETGGTQYLYLNRDATVANSGIPGLKIDEVRIYNYARTPAQIAWDYNRGKPIGHWKMDEASGTQVDDWSGNGNHGTMTNMDPIGDRVEGKNNKALDFDGSNDYVGIGTAINNINAVSFWIKPTSTSQSILDLDGGTHNISISGGAVTATGFNTYYVDGQLNGTISDTNWHHITAISNTAFNSTTAFTIGKINTNYYSGNIDDVKIYNYIPTDEQIKLDYNNGAVNFR